MPASEIDDIFASKTKAKPAKPLPSTSKAPEASTKPSKKNSKKRKREADPAKAPADGTPDEQPAKRRVPETIIDPSTKVSVASSSNKPLKTARPPQAQKKHKKSDKEDEQRFKDSRGTGPRRKTEEGWSIYKEDELGITDAGGDTSLCPFDCQCCF